MVNTGPLITRQSHAACGGKHMTVIVQRWTVLSASHEQGANRISETAMHAAERAAPELPAKSLYE